MKKKKKFISIINKYWEKNKYNEYYYEKKILSYDIDDYDKELYNNHQQLNCYNKELERNKIEAEEIARKRKPNKYSKLTKEQSAKIALEKHLQLLKSLE